MSDINVTASFNAGEWSPAMFARVDIAKYRSAAALLENFFVDYRGGASTRPGTKYIIQAKDSTHPVRLITFQASFNVGFVLEFGHQYIRFIFNGSPVLENTTTISGATQANPCVITDNAHGYSTGDWVFISGIVGMTQLNGRYFIVGTTTTNTYQLKTLNNTNLDSTGYTAYSSGGTAQRIYTIPSPYAGADLALLKFAQAPNEMILCHPSYAPYKLVEVSALSWVLTQISFGSTINPPSANLVGNTTLPVANIFTTPVTIGTCYYSYQITSIDAGGQESTPSSTIVIGPPAHVDIRTYGGSNSVSWNPVTGAVGYNVYEADISYFGVQPPGVFFGFVGTCTGTSFIDSNIAPDFSQGPPVAKNPFVGSGVAAVAVTAAGTYTTVPGLTGSGGSPATPATFAAVLGVTSTPTITSGGSGFLVGDTVNFGNGLVVVVSSVSTGAITAWSIVNAGSITSGSTPSNPIAQFSTTGNGTGATATATWGVINVIFTSGLGYSSAPTITPSSGAATFLATLSASGAGNPGVPGFFQQRLVLGAASGTPSTFNMSQPGSYFNFNVHNPVEADDAIQGTLVSNTLNTIKSFVSVPAGLLVFSDQAAWVVNGGFVSQGVASQVTPSSVVAAAQSFIGASDVPPIVANFDVLYVESKGSKVRDLTYNIYFNVFSGEDISITSSQLFYGFTVTQWAWAEQPFYVVWAVRNDGVMLTLTFLKEQQFVGWTHQKTQGAFLSVTKCIETTASAGVVDAVYTVVQRTVNSNTLQYIERVAERTFPNGLSSAWCVDCALQYTGSATLSFQGAEQLAGLTVTGLATDDLGNVTIITPFTMPITGFFTLPAPTPPGATGYTTVTIGLPYTCKLQTLPLDISQDLAQGKVKKIPYVDVRVVDTLGLSIGSSFSNLVPMKDLIPGNISSMLTGLGVQLVSGLYAGDARTYLDPTYTVYGQYCIEQSNPYPATILGVFPAFVIGDDR